MTRPARLPTLRSQSRHHDRRLPQIPTPSFNHDAPISGHWVFNWPTSAPASCISRSVGRCAFTMQCGSMLIHEKLLPRPCGQHALDISSLTPRRTLIPHGHVVLCTLLALAGRDAFKLQDRARNTLSKRARDRRFSKAWSSATLTYPHGIHSSCPHSNRYDSLYRLHVVLQIECDCCVTGHGLPSPHPSIHFQVPLPINQIVDRRPSTVRQADSAPSLRL